MTPDQQKTQISLAEKYPETPKLTPDHVSGKMRPVRMAGRRPKWLKIKNHQERSPD